MGWSISAAAEPSPAWLWRWCMNGRSWQSFICTALMSASLRAWPPSSCDEYQNHLKKLKVLKNWLRWCSKGFATDVSWAMLTLELLIFALRAVTCPTLNVTKAFFALSHLHDGPDFYTWCQLAICLYLWSMHKKCKICCGMMTFVPYSMSVH